MANIRALAKGLLGGGRRGGQANRKIGGWVRVDSDNVIRGWAADQADPNRRLTVRLFVDLKPVAEIVADRFDPKLVELGHGDGRHAFAYLIPPAFRDERQHAFEAVVEEAGYRLVCREPSFVIEPAASAARLALLEVTPTGLRARLRGGQYGKDVRLELWNGGRRIDPEELPTTRLREGPQAELRLTWPRDLFYALTPDAAVAAPGMMEAGQGVARLFEEVRLTAEPRPQGLALRLDGPLALGADETVTARVLAGEEAAVLASAPVALGEETLLPLPGGAPADGTRVEVTVGGHLLPGLSASVGAAEDAASSVNLIRNPDLNEWPHGVIVRGGQSRFELAAGWHVHNRKSHASVRAYPTPLDFEGEACSLTLAAAKVADYCRLEAGIEARPPLAGRRLELSFEAAIAQGPTGAFQSREAFLLIDRVFLRPADGREGSATIARNLVLTREMRRFAFRFEAPADLAPGAVAAFDFKRPFAVTLQRPSLVLVPRDAPEPAPPLAFEDQGLEAQAGLIQGLETWRSSRPVAPPAPDPGPGPATPPPEGPPHPLGSVEVVVCMHDAADETLACLASLAQGSSTPHRVRVIDDASSPETAARIDAFIADKPWMGRDPNPRHLGYTASANRGIRSSGAYWVVLLNSDTVVTPGWLEGLLEAAGSGERIAMAGPLSNAASFQSVPDLHDRLGRFKVNEPPPGWGPARMAELVAGLSERAFPSVPLLNGFCALIRREAFLAVGGFNEAAFPAGYGEENDLCLRLTGAGWTLVVADQVYVHHAKSASFGAQRRAELAAEGMAAMKRLHPGMDFAALGDRMRENPVLVRMRDRVRETLKGDAG